MTSGPAVAAFVGAFEEVIVGVNWVPFSIREGNV